MLEPIQYVLGLGSGVLIGFTLALVGGGGSILATPLIIYVVGIGNAHAAIGTTAMAVAVNALFGLISHARAGTVKWRCGFIYAFAGMVGAFASSSIGRATDGRWLLLLFATLMIGMGLLMLRHRLDPGEEGAQCTRENLPRLLRYAVGSGALSGFFGIGGGFLIVPGLTAATRMPMINAIGTSLVAVTAFGLATAANYGSSGLVIWPLVSMLVGGGCIGGIAGLLAAQRLSRSTGALKLLFAVLVVAIGIYILVHTALLLISEH